MHRVVIDISVGGVEAWQEALNGAESLRTDFGPRCVAINLVCRGRGLDLLHVSSLGAPGLSEHVLRLAGEGITFTACRGSLRQRSLTDADLLPVAQLVESGIAEVVHCQESGYLYVKAD